MKIHWKSIGIGAIVALLLIPVLQEVVIKPQVEKHGKKQKEIIWGSVASILAECTRVNEFNKAEIEFLSLDSGRLKFETIEDTVYFKLDKNIQPYKQAYIQTVYVPFECISKTDITRKHIRHTSN